MKRILNVLLISIILVAGCTHSRKEDAIARLQGIWVTDWELTKPLLDKTVVEASDQNPKIDKDHLTNILTEFHNNQRIEFKGSEVSPAEGKWAHSGCCG